MLRDSALIWASKVKIWGNPESVKEKVQEADDGAVRAVNILTGEHILLDRSGRVLSRRLEPVSNPRL